MFVAVCCLLPYLKSVLAEKNEKYQKEEQRRHTSSDHLVSSSIFLSAFKVTIYEVEL